MYYSYVEIEYVATSFSPARTDLAVKLLTSDQVYQWRLLLEEYGPKIVFIKGIHNTMADSVLWLEYDPSVNQTAESFHTTKVRNKSSQRQCWMRVSKKLLQARH
jgi:hypothetical protein